MNTCHFLTWLMLIGAWVLPLQPAAGATALDSLNAATAPPTVVTILPEPGSVLRELHSIEVQFEGPVAGIGPEDLLLNGVAATNVTEFASGIFVFALSEPKEGEVVVEWAADHGITDLADPPNPFAGASWNYALDPSSPPAGIWITEFMTDNRATLRDEDGDYSDWIELYNDGDEPVSLQGFFLTDDPAWLAKWRFPDVTIGARAFLLVYASEKNKTNVLGKLHTNFKLASEGEYLALLTPRTNGISKFAPRYPPQTTDTSYGRARGDADLMGYFNRPTPGSANIETGEGFAGEVTFSRPGATFTEPFSLTLSTPASGAILRYTLDGNLPTNSSPVYVRPLMITNTVQVRARAFQAGLLPGPPRTEAYLLLHTNVVNFTSDLPVLIIHSMGKGAPSASRQNFAHLALFEPKRGVTSLTNAPTIATRSGIKLRGSSTQGLTKSSFAVELWDDFNLDTDHELLGLPADSDWVLYAPNNFEPVLIHNPFIHQLSREMGRYSSRTRFVEVYLNKATGPISSNLYNGIYVLEEKIKISPERVVIDRLQPEDTALPDITGGYLLKIDRLDPGDTGFSGGGVTVAYVDPKEREIRSAQRDPQEQYIKTYFSNFSRALNSANYRDPVQGYPAYIDVDGWIDFHVLEVLSGNVDAIALSTYFHKPRNGKIVFGPHWDFDRALGSTDGRDANPRTWQTGPFFSGWWSRVFRDPDFWQKWIDRYQDLRLTHFSQTNLNRLIDSLANEVRQAQPRERQKWRFPLRGGSYQSEVNLMKNWLSNRMAFIDGQLVRAPRLSASGSLVTPGFSVSVTGPTNAILYYTLDGTDPRNASGTLSMAALPYTGPITIRENARLFVRARNLAQRQTGGPPVSSPWSGPVAATFTVAPPPLLLTELLFHPAPPGAGITNAASDFEFLELLNVSGQTVSLPGYRFTRGIAFAFTTNSPVTELAPGQRLVLVRNAAAFHQRYPAVALIAGEFATSLKDSSLRLTMVGPLEEPIFDFEYHDDWQPLADGFGFSLVLRQERMADADLQDPSAWRLSAQVGGSPGILDPASPALPPILVNELLSNPTGSDDDQLELFNPTAEWADISGWYLSDTFQEPKKLRLPSGTKVPPNGYLALTSFASAAGSFSFSKFGEDVYLFSADSSGNLTGWFHGFTYGAAEGGVSFGRYVTSTGQEAFVAQQRPSFGAVNSGPRLSPIVLNELMGSDEASAAAQDPVREYLELSNPGLQAVPLFDPAHTTNTWRIRGSVDFDFPLDQTLAARSYLLVVGFDPRTDPQALARFRSIYSVEPSVPVFGPWDGRLSSRGVVRLWQPGELQTNVTQGTAAASRILVEAITYLDDQPWPRHGTSKHLALQRRNPEAFANDPVQWTSAPPSPGDTDSDLDGLPNTWELRYGLDPRSADGQDGPSQDPDQDGLTNGQEYAVGTAPKDPSSCLKLDSTFRPPDKVVLTARGVPGRLYTVEYCDDLLSANWLPLRTWLSSNESPIGSVEDPVPRRQRFYRLTSP